MAKQSALGRKLGLAGYAVGAAAGSILASLTGGTSIIAWVCSRSLWWQGFRK